MEEIQQSAAQAETPSYNAATGILSPDVYKKVSSRDENDVKKCKDAMDTLYVFCGLFSAVVTAFVLVSMNMVQADKQDDITALLRVLVNQSYSMQDGVFVPITPAPPPPTFEVPRSAVILNGLWLSSLIFSLETASIAGFIKQWLGEYLSMHWPTSEVRVRARQYRIVGLQAFKVFEIAAVLPLLSHVSLGLFFIGLCMFTASLNDTLANGTIILVLLWVCFIGLTLLAPLFSPHCPYKIPMLQRITAVFRVCVVTPARHIASQSRLARRFRQRWVFRPPPEEEEDFIRKDKPQDDLRIVVSIGDADDSLLLGILPAIIQQQLPPSVILGLCVHIIQRYIPTAVRVSETGDFEYTFLSDTWDLRTLPADRWHVVSRLIFDTILRFYGSGSHSSGEQPWLFDAVRILCSPTHHPISSSIYKSYNGLAHKHSLLHAVSHACHSRPASALSFIRFVACAGLSFRRTQIFSDTTDVFALAQLDKSLRAAIAENVWSLIWHSRSVPLRHWLGQAIALLEGAMFNDTSGGASLSDNGILITKYAPRGIVFDDHELWAIIDGARAATSGRDEQDCRKTVLAPSTIISFLYALFALRRDSRKNDRHTDSHPLQSLIVDTPSIPPNALGKRKLILPLALASKTADYVGPLLTTVPTRGSATRKPYPWAIDAAAMLICCAHSNGVHLKTDTLSGLADVLLDPIEEGPPFTYSACPTADDLAVCVFKALDPDQTTSLRAHAVFTTFEHALTCRSILGGLVGRCAPFTSILAFYRSMVLRHVVLDERSDTDVLHYPLWLLVRKYTLDAHSTPDSYAQGIVRDLSVFLDFYTRDGHSRYRDDYVSTAREDAFLTRWEILRGTGSPDTLRASLAKTITSDQERVLALAAVASIHLPERGFDGADDRWMCELSLCALSFDASEAASIKFVGLDFVPVGTEEVAHVCVPAIDVPRLGVILLYLYTASVEGRPDLADWQLPHVPVAEWVALWQSFATLLERYHDAKGWLAPLQPRYWHDPALSTTRADSILELDSQFLQQMVGIMLRLHYTVFAPLLPLQSLLYRLSAFDIRFPHVDSPQASLQTVEIAPTDVELDEGVSVAQRSPTASTAGEWINDRSPTVRGSMSSILTTSSFSDSWTMNECLPAIREKSDHLDASGESTAVEVHCSPVTPIDKVDLEGRWTAEGPRRRPLSKQMDTPEEDRFPPAVP
ncbi:hypothetical protein PsYK624_163160 [Phanerochaete sordida]|uniref:DUF6535 domain-containing protein n=1 Tax=Phanerochaete sordida TaxID=48140 RepID=A0A9P3GQL1_9APHY|nr:hypothetical protein PsYK624_163160 [Phanerochaete sordida]